MNHDPVLAQILRDRLEIGAELDESAELSYLERARLRLELVTVVEDLDRGLVSRTDAAAALERLRDEVASRVSA
ncbi:MAG: hypothetical protein JWP75_71 [Frondihabitans sp.]|nr:hypothetical protein [Frondihabitans sp.]